MTEVYRYFGLGLADHEHDDRYPAGDPTASTDGNVWAYDAASGGYLPKAANAHSHAKLDRMPDAETISQRTVYVSPTGSDTTGDGSSASRWATIQHAINQAASIFRPANSTVYYRIMCATGVYDQGSAELVIPPILLAAFNAAGQGGVWITSESGVASDVVITTTSPNRAILTYGSATIDRVTLECDRRAVEALGSAANTVFVQDCVLRRKTLANGDATTRAILSSITTLISVRNSSPAGQLYGYGLTASQAAVIGKDGSQPQGAIANESVGSGGVIR